ncbi:competence protein ComB [Helicobacter pylori]|nr:competence protein ComB [Helicobacter pylori]
MQLVGISVSNLKEISSKEKFLWFNAKSFLIAGFIPFVMIPWLDFLNSLILYVCFLLVFSIAEFFDEDISDILIAHSKIKTKTNSFYA